MKTHHSRRLQLAQPPHPDLFLQATNSTLHNNMSSPPPPPLQEPAYSYRSFDSSMVLTFFVLLTALFFMGFFSMCIRRLSSHHPASQFTSRQTQTPSNNHLLLRPVGDGSRKGLDPEAIRALPVYSYYHGEAKYQIDCAICLGQFEERETIKIIPYCKHMFHLECIDTWLRIHGTCPVCRGTQFLG